jgi:hypothetical protein
VFLDPNIGNKSAIRYVLGGSLLNKTQVLTLLSRNLYGRYPKDVKFQNSEYEVHPVDYGSQNFSFLARKGEAVGVVQFFSNGGKGKGA